MPMSPAFVGTEAISGPLVVPKRWLLAYAAALDTDDERYTDDARTGGIEAVPTLCSRFEWALQSKLRVHPALGLDQGESSRGVHFLQDSRFLGALRPGMTVEARGVVSEVRQTRSGALIRYAYSLRDLTAGADLYRTRSISIYRGVAVAGEARSLPDPDGEGAPLADADLSQARLTAIPVSRAFAHIYTECADIWNPIHTERSFALAAGLPDIILHGSATWALAGRALLEAYGEDGAHMLTRLAGRFSGSVTLPDTLTLRHQRSAATPGVVHFDVRRSDGESVLVDGRAELAPAT